MLCIATTSCDSVSCMIFLHCILYRHRVTFVLIICLNSTMFLPGNDSVCILYTANHQYVSINLACLFSECNDRLDLGQIGQYCLVFKIVPDEPEYLVPYR